MANLRLGENVDPASHQRNGVAAQIPSEELTTHAVIVGMTGSGKTGLGMVLIEECLRAGVPALLIDPKGDLTNLALTFPQLSAAEFEPWVNESDATKAGQSPAEFAAAQAQTWTTGLAGWGLGAPDVAALHNGVEVTIYTPGAPHGVELNIIGTLDLPADMSDPQAIAEEIDAYVTSILNLVGIAADPLSSREHILLSNLIHQSWSAGRALDLATLVASVTSPPIRKIGVLELDSYYPPADRAKLAMKLNGLLASPTFAAWLRGQRVDIASMLRTPDGRPRAAVISTSHLSDEQRQSATSVILAKLISWMRRQSGTTDLRTLLYLDEVAGYLPPTGNPPTKAPIMLLLKQARAFGLGVVLATQNPVDLDYKALSNTGTWMIGRLQTEQDKARLVDGLTSAAGTVDPGAVGDTISALGKREFVLKRASRDAVEVLTTRWALSYLRGPLNREQVSRLKAQSALTLDSTAAAVNPQSGTTTPGTEPLDIQQPGAGPLTPTAAGVSQAGVSPAGVSQAGVSQTGTSETLDDEESPVPPKVAAGIPVWYLDPAASWAQQVNAVVGRRLESAVIARVNLRYNDARAGVVHDDEYEAVLYPVPDGQPSATQFVAVDYDDRDLRPAPPDGAVYRFPPSAVSAKTWWSTTKRELTDYLQQSLSLEILANPTLKLFGRVGESESEFRARAQTAADDAADKQIAALADKYERKITALQRRIDAAGDDLDRERSSRTSTMAQDLLGGLFSGRKNSVTASLRRSAAANERVQAAEDKLADLSRGMADLQSELDAEVADIRQEWDARAADISPRVIALAKANVKVTSIGLVWIPVA